MLSLEMSSPNFPIPFFLSLTETSGNWLDVISLNIWDMLISLCNLVILILIIKHFLFKPIQEVLAKRQATVDGVYAEAEQAKADALQDKATYAEKLAVADEEAGKLLKAAQAQAEADGDEIVAKAKEKAVGMVAQAENEIASEKRKAEVQMKREIVDLSAELAGKILDREVKAQDHSDLVDAFISELDTMGDGHDNNNR
jgi:F-type H+-transporting ATPase subunit b